MPPSAPSLAVALVLSVFGCHRAASEGYVCGARFEIEEDRPIPTVVGPAHCIDDRSRNPDLTDEYRNELAKELFLRTKELEGSDDHACRLALLEQAYYLVPGKHGFALLVGEAAFAARDCEKASTFLEHFVAYGDPDRNAEKVARAQELITRIETSGCEPQP